MVKVFELVEDWENKSLKCCKCGTTNNVKQKYVKEKDKDLYYCDACVLQQLRQNILGSK